MEQYNCYCNICNTTLKSGRNSLSNHIYHSHKDITKEQYYLTYINPNNKCESCGSITKFNNLQKGFSKHCSVSCGVKEIQWNSTKGLLRKEQLSSRMENNTFSVGRPLGSKNKNPYPMDSPKVINRIKNLMEYLHSINHWHNMNIIWWSTKSEEKQKARINKWLNGNKLINYELDIENFAISEEGIKNLNSIFDIE